MQNILIKCPRCRQQKLKKNGTRNGGQVQQYRCLHCRRQRSESNDELIRCLCDFGHDVRRHGAITAVAFYFLGYSLLAIEKKTGVKSETLKRIHRSPTSLRVEG